MRSATIRWTGWSLPAVAAGVLAAVSLAAPAPAVRNEIVKDRAGFIPTRKYQPLPGKVVGVLVSDVAPFMAHEGRYGPGAALGFSAGGNSYRWVYVPAEGRPLITNLSVRIGEKGDRTRTYPGLDLANPTTVKRWGITVPYALVEAEVNGGDGAPADQAFVGTNMKRLDGTREYPLKVADVIAQMRKRHQKYIQEQKATLDKALEEARKKALGNKRATGPRQMTDLFYITWLPESKRLSVRFHTRITDGAYEYRETGGVGPRPVPLPLPPAKGKPVAAPRRRPPPPPPPFPRRIRVGTTFGIDFGVAYEVNKFGKVECVRTLPPESFQSTAAPPPGLRQPLPLPPRKK